MIGEVYKLGMSVHIESEPVFMSGRNMPRKGALMLSIDHKFWCSRAFPKSNRR